MLLGLSRHNKDLEQRTLKPSARHSSQVSDKPCYSSQTNQCYSSVLFKRQQENPSSKREGMPTQRLKEKRAGERASVWETDKEREKAPFGSSFYIFFPPSGPALCKLGQPGVLFVLPEVLRPSFDLPLFYFHGLSLPCLLATAILDSCFLF